MAFNQKWLGGLAAAALMAVSALPASADDYSTDQSESNPEVVVPAQPGSESSPDVVAPAEPGSESNPEVVVPAEPGEPGAVVVPEDSTQMQEAPPPAAQPQPPVQEEVVPQTVVVTPTRAREPLDNVLVEIGGGASTFTGTLGDVLEGGAGWEARAVIGARTVLGFELSYFGAANTIESADTNIVSDINDINNDNTVITSAGEGLLRLNLLGARAPVKPFVAGGVNYTRFDSNTLFDNREALGFPLAVGLQFYPAENFTIGARGDYRVLTDWIDSNAPDGDQWGGTLTLGANF